MENDKKVLDPLKKKKTLSLEEQSPKVKKKWKEEKKHGIKAHGTGWSQRKGSSHIYNGNFSRFCDKKDWL